MGTLEIILSFRDFKSQVQILGQKKCQLRPSPIPGRYLVEIASGGMEKLGKTLVLTCLMSFIAFLLSAFWLDR